MPPTGRRVVASRGAFGMLRPFPREGTPSVQHEPLEISVDEGPDPQERSQGPTRPWLPHPNEDSRRARHPQAPPPEGPQVLEVRRVVEPLPPPARSERPPSSPPRG